MSLINSEVEICNLALSHLGVADIRSIEHLETNNEKICARFYDITRTSLLKDCTFSFATAQAILDLFPI
jgi:hypothetical protein